MLILLRNIWELLQNAIGMLLSLGAKATLEYTCRDGETVIVYFTNNVFGCGVSLGEYILLDYETYYGIDQKIYDTVCHEHGHTKQSRMLGPFYLLAIGLPSCIGNIIDRICHKGPEWYYSQPWEAWADKLGGIKRKLITH